MLKFWNADGKQVHANEILNNWADGATYVLVENATDIRVLLKIAYHLEEKVSWDLGVTLRDSFEDAKPGLYERTSWCRYNFRLPLLEG